MKTVIKGDEGFVNELIVKAIEKKYGKKRVFSNLSAALTHNRFVVLLGANGSGKSTFLKICAGLAPIETGSLSLNGQSSRAERAIQSSYVSEESGFDPYKTPFIILEDQTKLLNEFKLAAAKDMCINIDLPLHTRCGELSAGQRHLLSLIVAIGGSKPFIFIDEVLANLDTAKKAAMLSILTDLLVEEDRMVVIATHAYENVEMLADGVIFLRDGRAEVISDIEEYRYTNGKSLKDLFAGVGK
ncbi:ATP-binding cassette domain-containing protein [Paenibacillaceae bacterium]|nr:ATP-binding cassette domain-containing protein [Paenibacillaceae bacterium]